ncbi:MAG: choice-of-anchor D domain-containing protein [Candidatus Solibacter sp.]
MRQAISRAISQAMSGRIWLACLILAAFAAPSARAQFELLTVTEGQERPTSPVYNLGSFYADEAAAANLRLRNTSAAPATLSVLTLAGFGFVLSSPALPVGVSPQASIDFTVTFRASETGSYSAALNANGISVLLIAQVLPRLTYRPDPLPPAPFPGPFDFGPVLRGATTQVRIRVQNESTQALTVPTIFTAGPDFAIQGIPPSGQILQPAQGAQFLLTFTPAALGLRHGTLTLGDRTYPLAGTGIDPPQPKPTLFIDLQSAASAQQGTVLIRFDAPSQVATTGAATLDFDGPPDSAIAFASGSRRVDFHVAPGDQQLALPFQTGTSAGTLTFSVELGGNSGRQSVNIAPAAPALTAIQAVRSAASVELRITGFDNTRTLGALAFTFYDASGNTLAPGVIRADAAADFARYFATSDLGGTFLLRLAFPVTGDSAGIAFWDAALTNSAGSTKTARTAF